MSSLHSVNTPVGDTGRDTLFTRALAYSRDLAARAAELDAKGAPPQAEINALKQTGLLNALNPQSVGGGGLDWVDGLRLVRLLSRSESSIGQLLGYHYVNSQYVYWAADDSDQAWDFGTETVQHNLYWGAAVNPRDAGLVLTRSGDHYVLNGRKTF